MFVVDEDFNTVPFTAIGTFTITGGTGRFEGATGGGTFDTIGLFLDEGWDSASNTTGRSTTKNSPRRPKTWVVENWSGDVSSQIELGNV